MEPHKPFHHKQMLAFCCFHFLLEQADAGVVAETAVARLAGHFAEDAEIGEAKPRLQRSESLM